MSFRGTVEIAMALGELSIRSFRKQGTLRFRMVLLAPAETVIGAETGREKKGGLMVPCAPYNVYKQQAQLTKSRVCCQADTVKEPSFIDYEQECYYSPLYQSKYQSQRHPLQEIVSFRLSLDSEQLENCCLKLTISLIFTAEGQSSCVEVGKYEGEVHRLASTCSYLGASFDDFGGLMMSGAYHSTVMEYRFEGSGQGSGQYSCFSHYLYAVSKVNPRELLHFYDYYRNSLEHELFAVQERHSDLLRQLNISSNYRFIKVAPNHALRSQLELAQSTTRARQGREHLWGLEEARERLASDIVCDFTGLKALIYQKWNEYMVFLGGRIEEVAEQLKATYDSRVVERLRGSVFSHQVEPGHDWTCSRYQDSGKEMLLQAQRDKCKRKEEELWRDYFPIENTRLFQDEHKTIKIFEEIYPVSVGRRSTSRPGTAASTPRRGSFDAPKSHLQPPSSHQSALWEPSYSHALAPSDRPFDKIQSEKAIGGRQGWNEQTRLVAQSPQEAKGEHVIVFVHGFQASRQDFILFKSCLEVKFGCRVLISCANEGRTEESIEGLGKRLAMELNGMFKGIDFTPSTRISFVGHSMGGIIIRSALSYIRNLTPYLHTYLSFSSPHLGYLYQPSALVQAGLWLLNTWQKSESLQQICMRDNEDPRRCFLYRLSENGALDGFRHLALLSSTQDEYVPYESARIEKNPTLLGALNEGSAGVVGEMVDNMLLEVEAPALSRINVVFDIEERSFDSWVGRTAHIKYLCDSKFINMFTTVYQHYFK